MIEHIINSILFGISFGYIWLLIAKTNFVYEYYLLFANRILHPYFKEVLLLNSYDNLKKQGLITENYFDFLNMSLSAEEGIFPFLVKLFACAFCFSTWAGIISMFFLPPVYFLFVAFVSATTAIFLTKIKK
jgi:hypothetical protein